MLPLREFVCRLSLAWHWQGLCDPAARKVKNMKKVSLDKLTQVKLYPRRLRFADIFPTLCALVHPSGCPAGGKDAWKFRISVNDYKTSLKSFLVGAFRTQLNLSSIDLSSGPSSLCPILNGDFCNHLLGRERCSAVSDGGSSATRCSENIFVSFQNIRIQNHLRHPV